MISKVEKNAVNTRRFYGGLTIGLFFVVILSIFSPEVQLIETLSLVLSFFFWGYVFERNFLRKAWKFSDQNEKGEPLVFGKTYGFIITMVVLCICIMVFVVRLLPPNPSLFRRGIVDFLIIPILAGVVYVSSKIHEKIIQHWDIGIEVKFERRKKKKEKIHSQTE